MVTARLPAPGKRAYSARVPTRSLLLACVLAAAFGAAGCREQKTGPVAVSVIGGAPALPNPNSGPIDPPSAFLAEATAQGLVRFDPTGQIEPALAQSWIVSDDGLRYTFRLAEAEWAGGGKVTADQVAARLKLALAPASRNRLKPILGVVDEILPMTDEVVEVSLKAPRPNFLQILAQPEMAVIRGGAGTGPYHSAPAPGGAIALHLPQREDEEAAPLAEPNRDMVLRGERAGVAVARFSRGLADLVTGGTAGDLPVARAASPPRASLVFDPVAGMFGLVFLKKDGVLADSGARRALSMALDRGAIVAALAVPDLQPRESLLPPGIEDLPQPGLPGWAALPLPARRDLAARTIAGLAGGKPVTLRISMPDGPGYRLVLAYLRRDWRTIGIEAERAPAGDSDADLAFVDEVAPVTLASWYLRHFTCASSLVCDRAADEALDLARVAPNVKARREQIMRADAIFAEATPFLPIAAPIRWSLVSPRLTGFRANAFGRHPAGELIARSP
jgi:peptide/nickel transport system substrate-binding protein